MTDKKREEIHRPEGDTNTAKQSEILIADIEHAGRWVTTVWNLFDKQLPYPEFIAAYMTALHEWERGRKLVQSKLHWRYGPSRRRLGLIQRDARKQLALRAERLERQMTCLLDEHPELGKRAPELEQLRDSVHAERVRSEQLDLEPHPRAREVREAHKQPRSSPFRRDMTHVDPVVADLIRADTGLNVETSTDQEIFKAYDGRYGREAAIAWMHQLRGQNK